VVVVGLLVLGMLLIVGHGAVTALRRRLVARHVHAAEEALREVAAGAPPDDVRRTALRSMPFAERVDVFAALAPSLAGTSRAAVTKAADAIGLLREAARGTRSRRRRRRLRSARLFTVLGGGHEVMPALLDDPRPEVRAEAAQWTVEYPEPATIARLVELLGDDPLLARFLVPDALVRLGPAAVPALAGQIESGSGDTATGALRAARWIADPALARPARAREADPDPAIRARVAEVLGATGGAEAIASLERLLADDDAAVRTAASAALGRLGHWPAAGALAAALRDRAWSMRLASALSLRSFGPVGEVVLRRALRDEDRFAADIARHVLDLPATAGR